MTSTPKSDSSKQEFRKTVWWCVGATIFLAIIATASLKSMIERSIEIEKEVATLAAERYELSNVHNLKVQRDGIGQVNNVSLQAVNENGEQVQCLGQSPSRYNYKVENLEFVCEVIQNNVPV